MLRHIAGLVLLGVIAALVIRIAFALFGMILGLAVTVVVLTVAGYVCYSILQMLSPRTAAKVREWIDRPSVPKGSDPTIPNR